MDKTNTAVATVQQQDGFSKALSRTNADGKVLGKRLSFVSDYPAGDVRKALKAGGVKGKELTKQVNEVLAGKTDVAWAMYDAATSFARSNGFRPIIGDLNKKETKLTLRLEKIDVEPIKAMTDDELETELARRRAAKNGQLTKEQPTIEV